jgi:CTP:molybdopterin cytidylyltransferase MocA
VSGDPAPVGLILAAGAGRRFGGRKQLAEIDGRPMLEHAVRLLQGALDRVVVVLGADAEAVRDGVDLSGAEVVICPDWADGQSASLRCGLAAVAGAPAVLIALGDQPFLAPAALRAILDGPPGAAAVRATYDGRPGHPVLVRAALLERAGELAGDEGFRLLLAGPDVARVEIGHLGDTRDIDTREELEAARRAARSLRHDGE